MARNIALPLDTADLAVSDMFAGRVSDLLDTNESIAFTYTSRDGVVSERVAVPLEIVGTSGMDTYGFKGETDKGPRTFNFHLMG